DGHERALSRVGVDFLRSHLGPVYPSAKNASTPPTPRDEHDRPESLVLGVGLDQKGSAPAGDQNWIAAAAFVIAKLLPATAGTGPPVSADAEWPLASAPWYGLGFRVFPTAWIVEALVSLVRPTAAFPVRVFKP